MPRSAGVNRLARDAIAHTSAELLSNGFRRATGDMVDDLSLQNSDPALARQLTGEPDRARIYIFVHRFLRPLRGRASGWLLDRQPRSPGINRFRVRRRDVWSNSWAGIKGVVVAQPAPIMPGRGTGVVIVGYFSSKQKDYAALMDQAASEVTAFGARVAGRIVRRRGVSAGVRKMTRPYSSRALVSSGKVSEIAATCEETQAGAVVFVNP